MKRLPTAFLPNIRYLAMIARGEVFSITLAERWQKQSFRNRATLCTPQGALTFSLSVQKVPYPYPTTAEVQLSEHGDWRHRLTHLLQSNYSSTPFWIHYEEDVMALISDCTTEQLGTYNHLWLDFLCRAWQIPTPPLQVECSDPLPQSSLTATPLLPSKLPPIDYSFTHPSGTTCLPSPNPRYWQVFEEQIGFVPNLSALDLLLNQGPEGILYLRQYPSDFATEMAK